MERNVEETGRYSAAELRLDDKSKKRVVWVKWLGPLRLLHGNFQDSLLTGQWLGVGKWIWFKL